MAALTALRDLLAVHVDGSKGADAATLGRLLVDVLAQIDTLPNRPAQDD